jgi:hypothetical protein
MSMTSALTELQSANSELQQAIAELVMTVLEDCPRESDVAAIEVLKEAVSELQATAVAAGAEIDAVADVRDLPMAMVRIHAETTDCAIRYWQELRSYDALSRLRRAARGRGNEWRTWQGSVEQSELRCETAVQRTMDSVHAAWSEVGELLSFYLNISEQPAQASASAKPMGARRPS